jgi:hypothetical protein
MPQSSMAANVTLLPDVVVFPCISTIRTMCSATPLIHFVQMQK